MSALPSSFSQYYSDANEAESWMKEKEPLVTGDNLGRDEASAKVINCLCMLAGTLVMQISIVCNEFTIY